MEDEFKNFIKVWISATICLCYCYFIASKFRKGILRFFSISPIFYIFTILPFNLNSYHLGAPTTFFLIWLSNFKLLLFCFDHGPLFPLPNYLFHFISLTYLPIKLKTQNPNQDPDPNSNSSSHFVSKLVLFVKLFLVAFLFHIYTYKQFLNPYVILACYCLHVYLELEIILAISATPARVLFGFELEPQFNEPYRATSLQDFWGRRWNLMVASILRPSVYYPIRQLSLRFVGAKWASLPGFIATFVVSGLMHEVIYYYITRVSPTWEVTWFFILHGVCVAVEVAAKKVIKDRWQLHPVISGLFTVVFVVLTAVWLFFPQLTRNKIDDKVIREYSLMVDFVKQKVLGCFSSILRM